MVSHNYIFFTIHPSFYKLSPGEKQFFKKEFVEELKNERKVVTNTYATLGLKKDTRILLWMHADTIEEIQNFLNKLMHTKLGEYLVITHTLFGMTRQTQYSDKSTVHLKSQRKGEKYLVIYPFVKTKEWYQLPFEKRRNMMGGHVMVGKKYPQIEQVLLYSYGIDDSEFIVSYEMEDLAAFQSLVMDLRSDSVRAYTQSDTPIFTCIYKTPEEVVEFL